MKSLRKTKPTLERFWSNVDRPGDCWEWQSGTGRGGYGKFWFFDKHIAAHRFIYLVEIGGIPDGLFVCHRCDNPRCVRPDHLFLGTAKDNIDDCVRKGRSRGMYPRNQKLWADVSALDAQGMTPGRIARELRINHASVRYILRRQPGGKGMPIASHVS